MVRMPITDLDVVAYIGGARPEDAPQRLLPIYRSRTGGVVVVPPAREHEGALEGPEVTQAYLDALLEDEEATLVVPPFVARPRHTLWMSPAGPRYEPIAAAERELDAWAVDAVREAGARGLRGEGVRDLLFGALRVRPTVMANALLAVHLQLAGETRLARPVREDLVSLTGRDTGPLDRRLLDAAEPLLSNLEVATAVATEVRRAGRRDLADPILAAVLARRQALRAEAPSRLKRATRVAPRGSANGDGSNALMHPAA